MSTDAKRVLVLWADRRSANYGVRVLADGMADLARTAWGPNVDVDMQDYGVGDSLVSFGTKSILRDCGRKNGPVKQKLRQYDIVIDSGAGDSFADIYGFRRLFTMLYAQRAARGLGIPVVMGPQTIGPFNTKVGRWCARKSLRAARAVIARDSLSADYARGLGREVNAISTDVVFALPTPLQTERRDIVINISGLLWFGGGEHVDAAQYRIEINRLVTALVDRGRRVSLLAHVVNSDRGNDDADAIRAYELQSGSKVEAITPSSLEQARSVLASANLVIGSRMHACLNALSCGTPAIAWAYSRKFAPLMNDIGWKHVFNIAESCFNPATATLELIATTRQVELEGQVAEVNRRAKHLLRHAVSALRDAENA